MKLYGWPIFFVLMFFIGCTIHNHYYKLEKDTLSMYLKAPEAKEIFFASSIDKFKLHRAVKISGNTWAVQIPAALEFRYFFIVDGNSFVPDCKLKEKDDFGSENCLFVSDM